MSWRTSLLQQPHEPAICEPHSALNTNRVKVIWTPGILSLNQYERTDHNLTCSKIRSCDNETFCCMCRSYLPLLAAGFGQLDAIQCISHESVWARRCWHSTNSPDVASSVRQDARPPLTDSTEARGLHSPQDKTLSDICMMRNSTEAKAMLVLIRGLQRFMNLINAFA